MESVVSSAQIDQFGVLGLSQGCAFSIRYAAKHPEQVKCLILFGGYLLGRLRRNSSEDEDRHHIGLSMIDAGWGSSSQIYRNFFTSSFIPDASKLETDSFDELQRVSTNSSNARRIQEMNSKIDVVEFAKEIRVPTMVLHCEGDQVNSIKEGRHISSVIPNAEFVTLSGSNHVLLEGTKSYNEFFSHVERFLDSISVSS